MITKAEVAEILGLATADIVDLVFTFAQERFYILTRFRSTETQVWHREFLKRNTSAVKLNARDIKQLDTINFDNVSKTYTNYSEYTLNPDTGFVSFNSAISQGTFLEIQFTINASSYEDIHGYLIALLTYKGIVTFTPDVTTQVKSIKIGKFSRTFGNVAKSQEELMQSIDTEIMTIRNEILGDDHSLNFGELI